MNHRWGASVRASITAFDWSKIDPIRALRNTLGVVLPLAVGIAAASPLGGLVGAIGALNVSYSDGDDPYPSRARRMLVSSCFVALAVFAGGASGRHGAVAILLAAGSGFIAGMLTALGSPAQDIGNISLVTLLVYSGQSMEPGRAALTGLVAFAGGLIQTLLAVVLWPWRRYRPERRILGQLYLKLARLAASPVEMRAGPPVTGQMSDAQQALAPLIGNHHVESERYVALLTQAERIRLRLIALATHPDGSAQENLLKAASNVLSSIGSCLLSGDHAATELPMQEFQAALGAAQDSAPFYSAMQALAGQLRSAADLASRASLAGVAAAGKTQALQPWRLRLESSLATLQANLTMESSAFRHAIRLAGCLALGDALSRVLDWRRAYWIPMTIALVLRPDSKTTYSRGTLRLAGTFAGLAVATVLFHFLPAALWLRVVLIGGLVYLLRWLGPGNYGVLTATVSALVVALISLAGVRAIEVIQARATNTALGGALAMLAYWLWPTWERTQINEAAAQLLDAYRSYFQAVAAACPNASEVDKLDRLRLQARLARSNLEASADRLTSEPGAAERNLIGSFLSASHRFIFAVMALEAELPGFSLQDCGPAFQVFSRDVDFTLYFLANILRTRMGEFGHLPDLRDDHNRLAGQAGISPALVTETDRMTNSLDSIREQIEQWAGTIAQVHAPFSSRIFS